MLVQRCVCVYMRVRLMTELIKGVIVTKKSQQRDSDYAELRSELNGGARLLGWPSVRLSGR